VIVSRIPEDLHEDHGCNDDKDGVEVTKASLNQMAKRYSFTTQKSAGEGGKNKGNTDGQLYSHGEEREYCHHQQEYGVFWHLFITFETLDAKEKKIEVRSPFFGVKTLYISRYVLRTEL